MADSAHEFTNERIKDLDRRIHVVYSEAQKDIEKKMDDFNKRFEAKESIHLQDVESGKWTQQQFDNWKDGQVFQSKQWEAKRDQIVHTISNSNQIAAKMVNGETQGVFITNANYMNYSIEASTGVNFGFGVYDSSAVANLLKDNPQLLPKWKIDEQKDYAWNKKLVNNAVTQGIIQGEKLSQISKRIASSLSMRNENLSRTFARTAMTGAQNAGRQESLKNANDMGIEVYKQWMATLDNVTRDSHADLDGESVPVDHQFSNGLDYPGASGPPEEVYNCRCTMVADVKKYSSIYSRRDNETGKVLNELGPDTVANLSYKDWKITKNVMKKARSAEEIEKISQTLLKASALGSGTVNYQVGTSKTSFDFKYKGFDSLFRKITTKSASKGITKEQYAEKITDALRFTNLSPAETLTRDYFTIVSELESQGYKMVEVANTFIDYTSYRGINTLVQSPQGYIFELQFHTPQSMEIKEINHKLYEEERKLDKVKDAQKIREIVSTENKNAKSIKTPLDVDKIKNIG